MKRQLLITSIAVILFLMPNVNFGQAPDLGVASGLVLFTAGGAFNNTGATYVTGDIGSNSDYVTGFLPGIVVGTIYDPLDPTLVQAATDVGLAYSYLSGLTCGAVIGNTLGGGQILTPNIYCPGDASTLTGDLTLNGQGDCNSLFIFKINGAFSTSTNSNVLLTNGAQAKNVYWQINGQFTLGGGSVFRGTMIGGGAIILNAGATLYGRALTTAGAISLNAITATITQNEWNGSTSADWNTAANWSLGVVPSCSLVINAVIPAGATPYPVISSTGNYTDNLVIQNGATLTINPGKDLTVCGCVEINGPDGLWLQSDGTGGNASFVTTQEHPITYNNGTGYARVDLFLTKCFINPVTTQNSCWHYISSPVKSATAGVFYGDYMKSYDEPNGKWSPYYTHSFTPLNVMQGYAVSNMTSDETRTFRGELNDGTVPAIPPYPLTRTVNKGWGWNLVGNPYPSEIDLDLIDYTNDWPNVDPVAYYLDQSAGNYVVYPLTPPPSTGTRYVPSMQGFFVHVKEGETAGSIKFDDNVRTTIGTELFYKDFTADQILLKAEGSSGMNDQVIVYFQPEITTGYDYGFDFQKLPGNIEAPQLYAVSSDNVDLTIDGLPFAGINTVVPLGFSVSSNGTGSYSITASRLESFRSGTTVTLEDKMTQTTQVLTENPVYNFSYTEGENPERFLLHFYNPFFGIDPHGRENDLQIYSFGHDVYLKDLTGNPEKGDIFIYNMIGQAITHKPVIASSMNKYTFSLPDGYYIVRVITKDKTYNSKVYLD